MIQVLRSGDMLYISSIDRLGRNYKEILAQWRYLVTQLQVHIVVLDMPLLDTRNSDDLTGKLISDIVLQLLSYVAEKERDHIRKRQNEGIEIAKAKGVSFGRPRILIDQKLFDECQQKRVAGKATHKEIQELLNLKHSTYYNLLKEYNTRINKLVVD